MRVPSFHRFQRFMQIAAFFVCGMIVGSAVYNGLKNHIVNELMMKNIELQDQLATMRMDLQRSQQLRKENVIQSIVIYIDDEHGETGTMDIVTATELKKRLKADLNDFLGRSIYVINTDAKFARKLLESKVYDHVEDKNYRVTLKTMLLVDRVLQVWAEAKPVPVLPN